MLFVQFSVNHNRYILSAKHILSVIPLLTIHKMTGVPEYMVGHINYKGQTIPVVDLSKLLSGKKSKTRLSTRIILVNYSSDAGRHIILGLIAEKATEVVKLLESDFTSNKITSDSAPFLGSIANDSEGMLQKIDIDTLINLKVRDYLDIQAA